MLSDGQWSWVERCDPDPTSVHMSFKMSSCARESDGKNQVWT